MFVLCLYLCVCMSVANIGPCIITRSSIFHNFLQCPLPLLGSTSNVGGDRRASLHFASLYLPTSSKYRCNVYNMQVTAVWDDAARYEVH